MAKTAKRQTGDIGEEVACKYLQNKGFSVVERNYFKKWGEIDIIAKKAETLYFIEVKTVSHEPSWGYRPEENVHYRKIQRLQRAIQTYLLDRKVKESQKWQFDLMCVYLDEVNKKARVEVLENVIL